MWKLDVLIICIFRSGGGNNGRSENKIKKENENEWGNLRENMQKYCESFVRIKYAAIIIQMA